MSDPLVHFEIAGRDGEALEQFYSNLFQWRIERQNPGGHAYGRIDSEQVGGISGGIRHEPEGKAEIVLYIGVEDVEAAVKKVEQLGGAVRIPPLKTPEAYFALIQDPEGNPIGLVQRESQA
ncbi:MAG: VOC family protein [Planctomycetota bacterium]|nr:MAG: VOC family protein [Planctomycetota bacterium]